MFFALALCVLCLQDQVAKGSLASIVRCSCEGCISIVRCERPELVLWALFPVHYRVFLKHTSLFVLQGMMVYLDEAKQSCKGGDRNGLAVPWGLDR